MAAPRLSVFVASSFLPDVEAEWAQAFEATFEPTREPVQAMVGRTESFDALILSLDVPVGRKVIEALPKSVRAIATYSVGTDHIDLEAARERGLAVFNTPFVLSDSVAENALFLMLGAARRATESLELIRSGAWAGWNPKQIVGVELAGRRLGVLGLGDIGRRIARRAEAFGMQILYHNRSRLDPEEEAGARYCKTPTALFEEADVVMIACPSTPETRGLVDARLLASVRPDAILVNVARGDIVVDDALIAALQEGRLFGAGLDVFNGEPRVDPRYFDLPNVFMLPHIGSSTHEARRRMGQILTSALETWSKGGEVTNRVV